MPELASSTPTDQLRARLDDPQVAWALNTLLDNADVIALAAMSVNGFLQRADTISANVEGSLKDVKALGESASYLGAPTRRLAEEAPRIADAATALLDSGMLSREVVTLLGRLAGALVDGAAQAQRNQTSVTGAFAALRALKDPEVGRGLGFLIEVSRALGKTL